VDWARQTLKLKEGHGWKAKPGYKIFVLDRGQVRFDVPQTWIVEPGPNSVKLYDRQPPDDNWTLEVSLLRIPPIDWTGLPLPQLLRQSVGERDDAAGSESDIHYLRRPDLEMAWTENPFLDPKEQREACSRTCVARGSTAFVLLTLSFWAADAPKVSAAWHELIDSMQMGMVVKDPTQGPVVM